jgi:hypothetical protein
MNAVSLLASPSKKSKKKAGILRTRSRVSLSTVDFLNGEDPLNNYQRMLGFSRKKVEWGEIPAHED